MTDESKKFHVSLLLDPAFIACANEAFNCWELVQNFDRLYGTILTKNRSPLERMIDKATGYMDDQIRQFLDFVTDCIYCRLEPSTLEALRKEAMEATEFDGRRD